MSHPISLPLQTAILTLGVVAIGANGLLLSPILSDVAADMGTTPVIVARVISVYGAATALSALLLAGLIDRFGVRTALRGAALVVVLALFASALSPTWQLLALAQAVTGLAAGIMLPALYTAATAGAPRGEGARVLSRVLSGWALSLVLAVPAAALVADLLNWRFAYVGLALITMASGFGFSILPMRADQGASTSSMLPARAILIDGVPRLLAVNLMFMTAFYGTYALIGTYVRTLLGLDAAAASLVVLTYGLGFGLAGFLGNLVDRLGPARIFPPLLGLIALIYLAMPVTMQTLPLAAALTFLWGFFNHFGLNIIVLRLSERSVAARGAVMGANSAVTYGAVFAGPLLMGFTYQHWGFAPVALTGAVLLIVGAGLAHTARHQRAPAE